MQRRISRICSLHSTLDTAPSGQVACRWIEQGGEGKPLTTCKFWAWLQCSLHIPVCVCGWVCVTVCVATW